MKQFLAVCAACAAGYYMAQNFYIRIINKDGKEVYRSPQYKIKNKNSHEADEYGY